MRVLIFSRFPKEPVLRVLRKHNITAVANKPDLILCYGGDGTLLLAEAKYPGVPKILVRRSKVGNKAYSITTEHLIHLLLACHTHGIKYKQELKLQATLIRGKKKILLPPALNDVIIRNKNQVFALRLTVKIDGKEIAKELIGDGIVVSTPFGSTGYFNSITRKTFKKGIGIAFNNSTTPISKFVAKENSKIKVIIDREGGLITSDVSKPIALNKGDRILIVRAKSPARLIIL